MLCLCHKVTRHCRTVRPGPLKAPNFVVKVFFDCLIALLGIKQTSLLHKTPPKATAIIFWGVRNHIAAVRLLALPRVCPSEHIKISRTGEQILISLYI